MLSGVRNTVTWTDSVSEGTLSYSILRNTTDDIATASTVAENISAGTEEFVDTSAVSLTGYYYFVEVINGSEKALSDSYSITTVEDAKISQPASFQTENPEELSYNPATDSYELM